MNRTYNHHRGSHREKCGGPRKPTRDVELHKGHQFSMKVNQNNPRPL